MTNKNLTHLYFLLDRSGSMQSIRRDTERGFDAFIADQREAAGKCRVTLAQFDDEYDEVFADLDLADVRPIKLVPRGSTALLDALGRLIVTTGERLAALPEYQRPGNVVVAVMTDGYENASNDWTHARVNALIEQQSGQYQWQFLYLGADQDAIAEGAKMGFAADLSLTYDRDYADIAIRATSRGVRQMRDAVGAGASPEDAHAQMAFTAEDRRMATGA